MIICRTPLRVSLFGGGLDYPEWFNKHKLYLSNITINQYTYISLRELKEIQEYKYKLRYFETEEVKKIEDIKNNFFKKILLKYHENKKPIEIVYSADLPALSGLGSSSSTCVGLINAIGIFNNKLLGKRNLANNAIEIERNILKEAGGYQDQIASAFGGINLIELYKDNFNVTSIFNKELINELNNNFYLYYIGNQRSSKILEREKINQISGSNDKSKLKLYHQLSDLSDEFIENVNTKFSIAKLNQLINKSWETKKKITPQVTNKRLDNLIKFLKKNKVKSAKLVGSGSGGFILFYIDYKNFKKLEKKIDKKNIVNFKVDFSGSQIIFNSNYN